MTILAEDLARDGYAIQQAVVAASEVEHLRGIVTPLLASQEGRGGVRDVLKEPTLRDLASGVLFQLARSALGAKAFAVRGLLFDKTPMANWKVTWHQDVTIAVVDHRPCAGWGPWSRKAGAWHVRAPAAVLEGMVAVRLHLDECGASNGPLRVIPGSHRAGRLTDSEVQAHAAASSPVECLVSLGGALVMRPLLLHASAPATVPGHRRVIHIEYASSPLPDSLEWAERCEPRASAA